MLRALLGHHAGAGAVPVPTAPAGTAQPNISAPDPHGTMACDHITLQDRAACVQIALGALRCCDKRLGCGEKIAAILPSEAGESKALY